MKGWKHLLFGILDVIFSYKTDEISEISKKTILKVKKNIRKTKTKMVSTFSSIILQSPDILVEKSAGNESNSRRRLSTAGTTKTERYAENSFSSSSVRKSGTLRLGAVVDVG